MICATSLKINGGFQTKSHHHGAVGPSVIAAYPAYPPPSNLFSGIPSSSSPSTTSTTPNAVQIQPVAVPFYPSPHLGTLALQYLLFGLQNFHL